VTQAAASETTVEILPDGTINLDLDTLSEGEVRTHYPAIVQYAETLRDPQTVDEYNAAGALLTKVLRPAKKRLEAIFDPPAKEARKIARTLGDTKKELMAPVDAAAEAVEAGILAWEDAEEARTRAEQAELEAAATAVAEEMSEAEATALEEAGDVEGAAAVREAPIEDVSVPVVPRATARPAGVSVRETWDVEITDMKAFVKAVSQGRIPIQALKVDAAFCRRQVAGLRDQLNWPGAKPVRKRGVAARAR